MRAAAAVVVLALCCVSASNASAQEPEDAIRFGVTRSTDTVTVGQILEVRVRVRAPADASIRFPENPDTSNTVQGRDPRTIEVTDTIQARDETAVYRLSAWDVGDQPIRLDPAIVTWQGAERRVELGQISVHVRSVLPADSALRVPKPARALWQVKAFPWWILAAVLAAIALGVLLWWWLKRRRQPRAEPAIDPFVKAQREFNRLEAMGLVDAGERTRFVALAVEVLRDYLAARYPDASLALTSRELVSHMRRHPAVPNEQLSRALHEADLAKFAGWALTEDRARALARDARVIVEHEHAVATQQPTEAAAA